jgi:hypothetical protein
LEEGRSIVWGQILQLRTPVGDLRRVNPTLAARLETVSQELAGAYSANSPGTKQSQITSKDSIETQSQAHRRLAEEWESIVKECRCIQGFEDFLRPDRFSKLSAASAFGNVVIINVHDKYGSDALIIPRGSSEIRHVALPRFTHRKAINLRLRMSGLLSNKGLRMRGPVVGRFDVVGHLLSLLSLDWFSMGGLSFHDSGVRGDRPADLGGFEPVLLSLWTDVVQPVFAALGLNESVSISLSRYRSQH